MSLEDVEFELGRPESKMALGPKKILIYADGTRLEFIDGKLVKENDQKLTAEKSNKTATGESDDPLVKAEDIIQKREEKTIGATVKNEKIDFSGIADSYAGSKTIESLQAELNSGNTLSSLDETKAPGNRIQQIGIAFGIEMLVTLLVLSIAFQVSGFPNLFRQLLLLSLAVALVGAVLDTVIAVGPLNPIRSGIGFIILLLLIRQITDVREWTTAIKIALLARLVSMAIIWLAMIGVSMLFSL